MTGIVHPIPDGSTLQAATDLGNAYTYLNALPHEIELLYPAQFGHNLVLTPHTYLMNAATTFTDTLYLDAIGNANAVFVIKIYGALSTGSYAKVILINGTLAKNIYWMVNGAVSLNDYSVFKGTIVCNNGAMLLTTGVSIEGRALTTTGALSTSAITAIMPPGCGTSTSPVITTQPVSQTACAGGSVSFSVSATGTSPTYQWRRGNVNLTNGVNITGATAATLTLNPVSLTDAGSNYNVVISGTFLPAVTSASVSLTVNPAPVPTIGSTNNPCLGSSNNLYYTESGQTNYSWAVSAGTIVNGQGTSTLNVTWTGIGQQNVSVTYSNSFGCPAASPGMYYLFVNPYPGAAGAISGLASVCAGTSSVAYATTPVSNATSYTWSLPAGATIATGAGTTNITVDFGPAAVPGNITVAGNSTCGNGIPSVLPVSVNPLPAVAGLITGQGSVCAGSTGVIYSVSPIAGAQSYIWIVPAGAAIVYGLTTSQISVDFGSIEASGVITVKGINGCGIGSLSPDFNVDINAIPLAPVVSELGSLLTSNAVSGNQWYYEGTAITGATGQSYTVTSNTGYYWCVVTLNGCSSGMSNKIWVIMTGMQAYPVSRSFSIYPVPNDGQFTASVRYPVDATFNIIVYDQLGAKFLEMRDLKTVGGILDTRIDLRPVTDGIYFVVFLNNENKIVKRILVKN